MQLNLKHFLTLYMSLGWGLNHLKLNMVICFSLKLILDHNKSGYFYLFPVKFLKHTLVNFIKFTSRVGCKSVHEIGQYLLHPMLYASTFAPCTGGLIKLTGDDFTEFFCQAKSHWAYSIWRKICRLIFFDRKSGAKMLMKLNSAGLNFTNIIVVILWCQ
jgi:hypothetical protein